MAGDDIQQEFLLKFKEEADELVSQLGRGLLHLEDEPDDAECHKEVARVAHTLKGTANMMGIADVGQMAHKIEELLALVRDGERQMTRDIGDVLLDCLDSVQIVLNQLVEIDLNEDPQTQSRCRQIQAFIDGEPSEDEQETAPPPAPPEPGEQPEPPEPETPPEEEEEDPEAEEEEEEESEAFVDDSGGPDLSEFFAEFKAEAQDLLDRLNQGLLSLEDEPTNMDVLVDITRAAHTLKGSSKLMGFDNIGSVAHKMEDRLKEVRDGSGKMTDELADFLFASLDKIQAILESGGKSEPSDEEEIEETPPEPDEPEPEEPEPEEPEPEEPDETPSPAPTPAPKPASPLANAFGSTPPTALDPEADPAEAATGTAKGPLTAMMENPDDGPTVSRAAAPPTIAQETIRVDTGKVDDLVNVSGEMVVNHIRFEDRLSVLKRLWLDYKEHQRLWLQIRDHLASTVADAGQTTAETASFYDVVHRFSRHMSKFSDTFSWYVREVADDTVHLALTTNDLQREVMALRMVPVAMAFDSFRRTIRDIAREAGKEVRTEMEGRETEIDKKMIEGIKDPLVHLVRNAIDHGIEPPADRAFAGKPKEGTLKLSAREEGDRIIIEVSDDGRGMSPQQIKESALRKGVVTHDEAAEMTDDEILDLIFRPAFSTMEEVTETSGRGVGMDVVKSSIEALKGEVHIRTEVGKGTTFCLALPLTLAVTRVLFVEVSGSTFGLPTPSVQSTAKISRSEIKSIERREAIQVRNRTIPLVALSDLLGLPHTTTSKDDKISVVILQSAGEQIAYVVETVIGEQEIVLKNLGVHLQRVPNVAGAALLGSGDVVLVLHVPDLFASSRLAPRQRRATDMPETAVPLEQAKRVLIVEDSLTTRELERNILAAHGYEVDVANDGIEGLQKLSGGEFDLVVADISMPRMDGFQMITRIKEDESLRNTPVILVTASDRPDDRRRGMELGVEGYVVKSAFDQTGLLDTIQSLIG